MKAKCINSYAAKKYVKWHIVKTVVAAQYVMGGIKRLIR